MPPIGAIRWDAWTGDSNPVGAAVDKTLSPAKYHDRLPFYGTVTGTNSVVVNGCSQDTIDREIGYAHGGHLAYWAFVYYQDGSGLEVARKLYLSSSKRSLLNYCLIVQSGDPVGEWMVTTMFAEPCYQKVLGNRPLLYLLDRNLYTAAYVAEIRRVCAMRGIGNPYVVMMDGSGSDVTAVGADAVSQYCSDGTNGQSYSAFAADEIDKWNKHAANSKVVPWVTTGWDPRPRIDNPVPWTTYPSNSWVQRATPSQVAAHVGDGDKWAKDKGAATVIIYAWNEFDEGGWLCPSRSYGTDRIDAVGLQLH